MDKVIKFYIKKINPIILSKKKFRCYLIVIFAFSLLIEILVFGFFDLMSTILVSIFLIFPSLFIIIFFINSAIEDIVINNRIKEIINNSNYDVDKIIYREDGRNLINYEISHHITWQIVIELQKDGLYREDGRGNESAKRIVKKVDEILFESARKIHRHF